jgi:hypothetical protein
MLRCLALPLDEAHLALRHLPPGYMDASPYFRATRKRGIIDMMHFILIHEAAHFASFAITRRKRQGVITGREIELGELLLPHLRRAVTISTALDVRTVEGARMSQTPRRPPLRRAADRRGGYDPACQPRGRADAERRRARPARPPCRKRREEAAHRCHNC